MAFLVRSLHVFAAAFILGGALLVFAFSFVRSRRDPSGDSRPALDLMAVYEYGFWAAIAIMVATGIGNLAHFGKALPGPGTGWGHKLEIKLTGVTLLILLSVFRTALVTRLTAARGREPDDLINLTWVYAASSVFAVFIVGMAVLLAHF